MRLLRPAGWCCGALAVVCTALWAEALLVRSADDELHVAAPSIHFLSGKPLDRIRTGNVVPYDFQLSVLSESKTAVLRRTFDRFAFSYDIWDEKYAVTRMRSTRGSASKLTAQAAEAWCVDKMVLPLGGLPSDEPLWLRLEIRAQDPRDRIAPADDGMSLKALIDLFSLAGRGRQQDYWRAEAGPLKLSELRRAPGIRGAD